MHNNPQITSFTDIVAWKKGHELVLNIYKVTKKFPQEERYCLVDQLKRASVSVTSNIAEGFSRNHKKEKIQFYRVSLGSLTEIQNQLLVAKDVGYISVIDFDTLAKQTIITSKLINGLIKGTSKLHNS